jgi:hypothetical protein
MKLSKKKIFISKLTSESVCLREIERERTLYSLSQLSYNYILCDSLLFQLRLSLLVNIFILVRALPLMLRMNIFFNGHNNTET